MFNVGDSVKVVNCDSCNAVVGKVGVVKLLDGDKVQLSFGRGRPKKGTPEWFNTDMLSSVETLVK